MARTRSVRISNLKDLLIGQLSERKFVSGDRFPSARTIASNHKVSYQTAHRILEELETEGYIERRSGSGSYVPGHPDAAAGNLREIRLIMSSRARRPHSFGARLLAGLADQLRRLDLRWQFQWAESMENCGGTPDEDGFPVLWEAPDCMEYCRNHSLRALILNDRPAPGLDATLLDSVSLDDFFGGCCAAEMLQRASPGKRDFAVISGPDDLRSNDRVGGFRSRIPRAAIIPAGGWYLEHGLAVARRALQIGKSGIFCVNDRLAEAVVICATENGFQRPPLVGFDNAPIATDLNLSTIAIPWEEMAADAANIIERRINRDTSAARRRLITPQPILRQM
jgi:DNA-binding LacI/PurR family transcriptional regulator